MNSDLGHGAKIPHASWPKNKNIKQKLHCNKFNEYFSKTLWFIPGEKMTIEVVTFLRVLRIKGENGCEY